MTSDEAESPKGLPLSEPPQGPSLREAILSAKSQGNDRPWIAYVDRLLTRHDRASSLRVKHALAEKILAALPKIARATPVVEPSGGDNTAGTERRDRLLEALRAEGVFAPDETPLGALARDLYEQARTALVSARDLALALATRDDGAGPYNASALAAEALREASKLSRLYLRAVLAQLDLYRVLSVLPPAPEPKALKGPGRAHKPEKKGPKKKPVDKSKSLKAQMRPGKK